MCVAIKGPEASVGREPKQHNLENEKKKLAERRLCTVRAEGVEAETFPKLQRPTRSSLTPKQISFSMY